MMPKAEILNVLLTEELVRYSEGFKSNDSSANEWHASQWSVPGSKSTLAYRIGSAE